MIPEFYLIFPNKGNAVLYHVRWLHMLLIVSWSHSTVISCYKRWLIVFNYHMTAYVFDKWAFRFLEKIGSYDNAYSSIFSV